MFVGHGLLAFTLVALVGIRLGWDREHTLTLAVLAFGFGTLPDIDILYAPVGLLGGVSGVFEASEAFWQTGNVVHRVITHSLPVGFVAAIAFGLWALRPATRYRLPGQWTGTKLTASRLGAVGLLFGLVVVATAVTGGLGGMILGIFALGGLALTSVAMRYGVGPEATTGTALVGLLTHPFGDLLTGTPPPMLYPFDVTIVAERITLHPDPTIHLLGAFLVELSTFWLAGYAYLRLRNERMGEHTSPRAAAGLGYAGAALVIPAPTLSASAHFVFSVLAIGVIGWVGLHLNAVLPHRTVSTTVERRAGGRLANLGPTRVPVRMADSVTAYVTGLSAVTLAVFGYALAYLFL